MYSKYRIDELKDRSVKITNMNTREHEFELIQYLNSFGKAIQIQIKDNENQEIEEKEKWEDDEQEIQEEDEQ